MHDRHALALVGDRVFDGRAEQAVGAFLRRGLQANAGIVGKPNLGELLRKILLEQRQEFLALRTACLEFDAGVDVLGVFTEYGHVDLLRMLDGRRHTLEPAHRPQAHIEIQQLPQGDVERANAAAHRGGQRSLDRYQIVAARRDGFVGEPGVVGLVGLLTGENFHPMNLALAAVGLLYGSVEHPDAGAPDIPARAIALDERDDGLIGDVQFAVRDRNFLTARGDLHIERFGFGHR